MTTRKIQCEVLVCGGGLAGFADTCAAQPLAAPIIVRFRHSIRLRRGPRTVTDSEKGEGASAESTATAKSSVNIAVSESASHAASMVFGAAS